MSGIDLTAAFRKHGILRISDNSARQDGTSFSVYLRGNIVGTGTTIGEALDSALRTRAGRNHRRIAA